MHVLGTNPFGDSDREQESSAGWHGGGIGGGGVEQGGRRESSGYHVSPLPNNTRSMTGKRDSSDSPREHGKNSGGHLYSFVP